MGRMALDHLKNEPMMAHLLATLDSGHSIGHYGRLVLAMVGRHFLSPEELATHLEKDPECNAEQAKSLIRQVESRDYNPPKRERILEWMRRQEFPVCPAPDDPSQCNVYRNLDFPKDVYDRIAAFHAEPSGSGEKARPQKREG